MAEIIAVVGGIASVSQVLVHLAQVTKEIVDFCNNVAEAPRILLQIQDKLRFLQQVLKQLRSFVVDCNDSDILTPETRGLLLDATFRVQDTLSKAQQKGQTVANHDIRKTRKRLAWVLKDQRTLKKLLEDLDEADCILQLVIQLATFKAVVLTLRLQSSIIEQSGQRPRQEVNFAKRSPLLQSATQWKSQSIGPESWFRRMGFYGAVTTKSCSQYLLVAYISLGYKFPPWLWLKSFDFELTLTVPAFIRMQNRVSIDSPFMVACSKGDVPQIRQHLMNKSGSVGDRSSCTGQTPLLLAIKNGNIDAIKLLLEAGADPNIGDDDRIVPVFCALGMNQRRDGEIPQIPPSNQSWLDILRSLIEYDGSVHETACGRSLSMLNLVNDNLAPRTLEFFHILQDQYYTDFESVHIRGWSAFLNALRSKGSSLECLKFLEKAGLDFSRVFADGRCLLHLAAELSFETDAVQFLCDTCPPDYINRQDDLGWTPLHYGLVFNFFQQPKEPLAKIRCLVLNGADPTIEATCTSRFSKTMGMDQEKFTSFELGKGLRSDLYVEFLGILEEHGYEIPEEARLGIFHDAVG
ncbi:ankyrin repeat-containing domain protein [Thelonectria olida]|uniref:Ankyrin repeat-containing domain protein n=1 Tax=Thelonectria olida TaxID=1576542 RepID=A0A9P8W8B0_9HYPO|nr:ankyrin repeat-containing domain protein [Thelonectria olida]